MRRLRVTAGTRRRDSLREGACIPNLELKKADKTDSELTKQIIHGSTPNSKHHPTGVVDRKKPRMHAHAVPLSTLLL